MKYVKVRDVKSPSRGTAKSAGIDFYCPKYTEQFENDLRAKNPNILIHHNYTNDTEEIILDPHEHVLIPSGIHVKFPDEYALIAFNKSGVATKKNLDILACVIDADFEGEMHLSLINASDNSQTIVFDEKLIQCLLIPVSYAMPEEIMSISELYINSTSTRKSGGFGSTGV